MDNLNQQVGALNHKVDRLYEILIQVNDRLSDLIESQPPGQTNNFNPNPDPSPSQSLTRQHLLLESGLEHKDVLSDDDYVSSTVMIHREQPSITADIQIQRLTAQLTAAYNRIAALEERLLSQRTPH
ncbi:hypothetical protein [Lyngbya sp. PCC 8106]|uniref:hypothetical protein n=1 Tax=Lyngbya sp. (strain PCC 8106) TaxID=313612 RepID=UPI0000EAA589|nr:hypothetical protein [Lyngbya sp. PCC 8106]EAW35357.1 hypothetical protein L8106_20775 [Lyngbya sp. PCC 8106]